MLKLRSRAGLIGLALLLAAPTALAAPAPPRAPTGKDAAAWSALVVRAEVAHAAGDWRTLEKATRKRVAIEERTYGADAPVTAASYSWIGQALSRQGRDAQAEAFFRRALDADRRSLGPRDPQTLVAMANLAGALERQQRFSEAEDLRRDLVSASQALFGAKSAETAAATIALADVLRAQARPAEAEPLYRAALETEAGLLGETDPHYAADVSRLAVALDDLGRHLEAEPLHRRALSLRRRISGERDPATAQAYGRAAANLDAQGRHADAEPLHRMALKADIELLGPRHPATAADYAALGANLDAQNRPAEAEPLLRKALDVRRRVLGEKDPATGASHGALGANLARRGTLAAAERQHRRALRITLAARGERDPATAAAYVALAADLSARGRPAKAEPLLERALEIRRAVLGEKHPATAEAYDALAEAKRGLAAYADAESLSAEAVAIVRSRRAEAQGGADTGGEAALRRARANAPATAATGDPVLRRYLQIAWMAGREHPAQLARLRDAAFTAAQDLDASPAARALARSAGREALARKPAAAEARVQQQLADQVLQLEGKLVQAMPDDDPGQAARMGDALDAVGRELASLEARLKRDNPKYAQIIAPAALTLAEAQGRLRPGEGLLLVTAVGDDIHVFGVSRTEVAWNRIEGGRAEMERRIAALRCGIDNETCGAPPATLAPEGRLSPFDVQTAYSLYGDLVAPVEAALAGVDRLFVTASGPFGALPFGLLLTGPPSGDGASLVALSKAAWFEDRYALTTLPSVASLRTTRPAARRAERRPVFVGYGAPILVTADPRSATFAPLPGAATELRAMARALGAPTSGVHIGGQATEAAIKASTQLSRAAVIAFATHGLLSRELDGQTEPGLLLSPPARAVGDDDGLLTASEAAGLNLNADWVILSACNTAGSNGAPGADSLSGLARAFLYAGARALLVSHWRVFDDSTAALTVQTLAIHRAHPDLTKAQALQKAMRVIRTGRRTDGSPLPGWRADWAHPAHWAPFVLISAGG